MLVNQGCRPYPSALSPGIGFLGLRLVEERRQLVASPIATGRSVGWRGLGEDFLLECGVGLEVDLRGFDRFTVCWEEPSACISTAKASLYGPSGPSCRR